MLYEVITLPKVTGYILGGVFLNPGLTHIIPKSFIEHTELVTNISLSFITFSVGGTLYFPKVRSLGKPIVLITLFEAEFAFLFVAVIFILLGPLVMPGPSVITSYSIHYTKLYDGSRKSGLSGSGRFRAANIR